jgi:hypothetical protein
MAISVVQNIVLCTGNGQNFLTWNLVPGATSYTVQRSVDQVNWATINNPIVPAYLDAAVAVGTNYFYRVSVGTQVAQASATMTLSANPASGGTFSIANVILTAGTSFVIGATTTITATNIVNAVTGLLSLTGIITASSSGDEITFFASQNGPEGTGIQFSNAMTNTVITQFVGGTSAVSANYFPSNPAGITPCALGQINLGYLRYQARLRSDMLKSNFLTNDEWNIMINSSVGELYDILVTQYGCDYFLAPLQVFYTSNQLFYPLPDGTNFLNTNGNPDPNGSPAPACYKPHQLDVYGWGGQTNNTTGWYSCSRMNAADHNKYNQFLGASSSNLVGQYFEFQFREMGTNLLIVPTTSGQQFRLWYVPVAKLLLQDTDMMPFSYSQWHEYVVVDVASKACEKRQMNDMAQALLNRKAGLMVRIETTAANRNVGQPNTGTNSRRMTGDPNFGNGGGGWGGFGGLGGGGWGY